MLLVFVLYPLTDNPKNISFQDQEINIIDRKKKYIYLFFFVCVCVCLSTLNKDAPNGDKPNYFQPLWRHQIVPPQTQSSQL